MKYSLILITLLTIFNVNFNILPSTVLLVAIFLAMVLDFLTGIIKASVFKQARHSEGYRKTVIKGTQYGAALAISIGFTYLTKVNPELSSLLEVSKYFGNSLQFFILFIEITSIFENLYAIDSKSLFSRLFIKPILKLTTFQLKTIFNDKIDALTKKEEGISN